MSFVREEKKTSHKTRKRSEREKERKKKTNWLPCQIINREDMGFCQDNRMILHAHGGSGHFLVLLEFKVLSFLKIIKI